MLNDDARIIVDNAIDRLESMRDQQSGGKWLKNLTAAVGPYIKDWDFTESWTWAEWADREITFPGSSNQDIGIDVVAVRRIDSRHVAIQCKSRHLENGIPVAIQKSELDSFANASSNPFWAERWLVTNGEAPFSPQAGQALSMVGVDRPVKPVNIHADLLSQRSGQDEEPCPHCEPDAPQTAQQTKQCMQDEAVATAVSVLQEHVQIESPDRDKFQELADQWEEETFFLSRSDRAIAHPLHQEIIALGHPVIPLILERMRSQGGHWFEALQHITGEDPVSPADYGNIAAMQISWLQWGENHGYA